MISNIPFFLIIDHERVFLGLKIILDIIEINNWAKGIAYTRKKNNFLDNKFIIMYSGNMGLSHDFSLMEAWILLSVYFFPEAF